MRRIERLRKEAIMFASARKHFLGKFEHTNKLTSFESAEAKCIRCGCYVSILAKPHPNEIDIGGTAVAINCTREGR